MLDNQAIVKVAVPRRVWDSYDYSVPSDTTIPRIGARVSVPLGRGRAVGIVIGYSEESKYELKDILNVVDESPFLSEDLVELGSWMSEYYHHPLGSVFETILPRQAINGMPAKAEPEQIWRLSSSKDSQEIKANATRQRQAYEAIRDRGEILESELKQFGITKSTLKALEEKQLIVKSDVELVLEVTPSPYTLTDEQEQAVGAIKSSLNRYESFLVDGITGSGKTEVYLQVIEQVLRQGRQALLLVPEIALTPQMTARFQERFSSMVIVHSMISNAKRFETWTKAALGDIPIVVGTRSAIFTPFRDLGIIVVDEEHDHSYKQIESLRYSARDLAIMRANKLDIPCVLGSATPSLESVVNARRGRYRYLRLSRRPGAAKLPSFHIQDMRQREIKGGICLPLLQRIEHHLDQDGQVLVLINRRGHSTKYFCQHCGWMAECDDCDVALTWHEAPARSLQCHVCGRRYQPISTCPACGEKGIAMLGVGTQQVEEALAEAFPNVPHYRIDRDSIRTNRQMTDMFRKLQDSHEGLLIGTQMLAKGHHFPNVTLVAVIAADMGFLSTDFRGPERTAQLIVQVAGRAGRAQKPGEVWIQTYDPDNVDLQSLVRDGYEGFTDTELKIRADSRFPPFGQIAVIRAEGTDENAAEEFCTEVLDQLRPSDVSVLGPVSAPIRRVAKQYRFQGVVLAQSRKQLHSALRLVERMRPKSRKTRWSIDVDPSDLT